MKKSRFSEEQIIRILAEVETGRKVSEVCRQYKVSEGTIYRWKQKYGGMDQQELKRMKELESENARLKKIVAQYAMDIDTLKETAESLEAWRNFYNQDRLHSSLGYLAPAEYAAQFFLNESLPLNSEGH